MADETPGAPATDQPTSTSPGELSRDMLDSWVREHGLDPANPELVFGLVHTLGCDMQAVMDELDATLSAANYESVHIKLSASLKPAHKPSNEMERYELLMDAGDQIRKLMGQADAACLLGIQEIYLRRDTRRGKPAAAYIIDHLMHPEEVRTLRAVYGRRAFIIAADAPLHERRRVLAERFQRRSGLSGPVSEEAALHLINRDAGATESRNVSQIAPSKYRLAVGKTLEMADLFVQLNDPKNTRRHVRRLVESIMGNPFHTPTLNERGMAIAYAMSLTTSTLSRRVGAAIMKNEQVISVGANEVPKSGGGTYHDESQPDGREFVQGSDPSDAVRAQIVSDLIRRLQSEGWLDAGRSTQSVRDLVSEATNGGPLAGAQVMDIIEYGRTTHAEMVAITGAARLGVGIEGATIYSTTLPCHECTRNIIASGVSRLVYIEPYPKSKGAELQADSMTLVAISGEQREKVAFEPFAGFSPQRFSDLFSWVDRKQDDERKENNEAVRLDGAAVVWKARESRIRRSLFNPRFALDELITQLMREEQLLIPLPRPKTPQSAAPEEN